MNSIKRAELDRLINLIEPLKTNDFGKWIINNNDNGTMNFPFVYYSDVVDEIIKAIYDFHKSNPEFELNNYRAILGEYRIKWGMKEMIEADPSKMDEKVIMAMLMGMVRAERFSEGTIMEMLESGCVLKWLERLKNI